MKPELFNRSRSRLYKSAVLLCTGKPVALTAFIPASPDFGHGDFYWVKTETGEELSAKTDELTNYSIKVTQ